MGYGWGMYTREDLEEEETVLDISREFQINIETAVEVITSNQVPFNTRDDSVIDCVEALALFLCIEARKGEKSIYWPQLRILPKDFSSQLENWPEKFDKLLPPYMVEVRKAANDARVEKFKIIEKLYNKNKPEVERITPEEFAMAYTTVYTRYKEDVVPEEIKFPNWLEHEEGCGSLVPIFDMINHSHDPNCDWNIDDGVLIYADEPIKAGSELFIQYGPQFNDRLVQYYGFSLARMDNP